MGETTDSRKMFIHRDMSWIEFNGRVLEEASDEGNPLLERLKFLATFFNNYDEFYMVRVAGLRRLIDAEYNQKDKFGFYPSELYEMVKVKTEALFERAYDEWRALREEMGRAGIHLKKFAALDGVQAKFVKRYFDTTLFPIMTPMAVDQGRPLPVLASRSMSFALSIHGTQAEHFGIIVVPKNLSRALKLPSEAREYHFILVDEIIRHYLEMFFRGFRILNGALFRIVRDSELSGEEDYEDDLLQAIEGELKKRPNAKVVRLEIEEPCDGALLDNLCGELEFPKGEASARSGEIDLTFLSEIAAAVPRPELRYKSFVPTRLRYDNIFDHIREEGPFVVHHPFQSFNPTVDLIKSAARDPNVLAVKMTLYRTNEGSAIIKALKEAAKNGKQVTVLVEIKARFDEERNIRWVKELEETGCHVMYGVPGMKIHSKITLIVRREESSVRRYVHLSTGNYNEKTAALYTDIGYFTANDDFARDVSEMFNVITGYSMPSRWKRIVSSPFDLRQYFFEMIDNEVAFQRQHGNGAMYSKMNSLEDPRMIEKLYQASGEGVKARLLVRGICSLIPGVEGMSGNIEVRSVVGRFLEHSRIFVFNNNANPRVFLSSADWMSRNLGRRVELLFELTREELKEHLVNVMEIYWKDTAKARELRPGTGYARLGEGEERFNAQEFFIRHYTGKQ